ncbi:MULTISPECIES: KTSC domain-containing protein [Bacteroidota]|uniref:KTSC domain-containing protein n=1 Tax=Fontibacter flavus TaxID=654838 RepID=A0ABV6FY27_9BACT|nr:KTSC domain-containing protein [Flavobacterium lindanitolerans]
MNRQAVTSSNIASIGYDADSQTLEIEFLNGGVYQYFDVPQYVHEELMNASSHGQYLAQNIKGVYRFSKV